jgi:hypothetical protein
VCGLRDGDPSVGRGFDRPGAVEQLGQKGVQVLGRELVGGAVLGALDPGHDDAGAIEPVALHPGCIEVFAGLADRERGRRGRQSDAGASYSIKQAISVHEIARALG